MIVQIKSDLDEIKEVFEKYGISMPRLTKRVLGSAGMGIKKTTKKSFKTYFRNRTGIFYKSISYKVRRSGNSVLITSNATSDGTKKGVRYPFVLAAGTTITAKKSNYLTFMVKDGEWRKVKSTTIKPSSWVEYPAEKYLESNDYSEQLEKVLQNQIDLYFKKEL